MFLHSDRGYLFEITINGIIYQFQRDITSSPYDCSWMFLVTLLKERNENRTNGSTTLSKNNTYPEIFIISRYLIDYSDIGNTFFKLIKDDYIKNYDKACPKIVYVLKGNGNTSLEKITDLYFSNEFSIDGITFADNIVRYSMVKYFFMSDIIWRF